MLLHLRQVKGILLEKFLFVFLALFFLFILFPSNQCIRFSKGKRKEKTRQVVKDGPMWTCGKTLCISKEKKHHIEYYSMSNKCRMLLFEICINFITRSPRLRRVSTKEYSRSNNTTEWIIFFMVYIHRFEIRKSFFKNSSI